MRRSFVKPDDQVVLRLPSGVLKVVQIAPNTIIGIGKYGAFRSNLILGRPYHLTYEIIEADGDGKASRLRPIPAAELHAEVLAEKESPADTRDDATGQENGGVEFDIVAENGEVIMRNNRLTVDDPTRQALSMEEIEELKKAGTNSGKEIIEKIMASHSALKEKTSFSLAKYTLRKSSKYLKRFTILPLDVNLLAQIISEKEASRIMDLRMESLGLLTSWANIHHGVPADEDEPENSKIGGGRWLVADDTGGLVVAAIAEKMGILFSRDDSEDDSDSEAGEGVNGVDDDSNPTTNGTDSASKPSANSTDSVPSSQSKSSDGVDVEQSRPSDKMDIDDKNPVDNTATSSPAQTRRPSSTNKRKYGAPAQSAKSNCITLVHPGSQPNLSMLNYFGYNPEEVNNEHPLYDHLKTLSWLQLLEPQSDSMCQEPEKFDQAHLKTLKSAKRAAYYKKRWRWERINNVVQETKAGGYDGLVVASSMKHESILKHLVPLVRGGGQIAIYSPTVEPLTLLMDYYSRDRRGAFVRMLQQQKIEGLEEPEIDVEDFPLDPTLLVNPMLQTSRARHWQVLPGRTHPLMTSRGGPEGFLFTATRVLPLSGHVEARGKFAKKKKTTSLVQGAASSADTPNDMEVDSETPDTTENPAA